MVLLNSWVMVYWVRELFVIGLKFLIHSKISSMKASKFETWLEVEVFWHSFSDFCFIQVMTVLTNSDWWNRPTSLTTYATSYNLKKKKKKKEGKYQPLQNKLAFSVFIIFWTIITLWNFLRLASTLIQRFILVPLS